MGCAFKNWCSILLLSSSAMETRGPQVLDEAATRCQPVTLSYLWERTCLEKPLDLQKILHEQEINLYVLSHWDLGFIYYQSISHPITMPNRKEHQVIHRFHERPGEPGRVRNQEWHDMTQRRFCCRNGLIGWCFCSHCQLTLATTA